MSLTCVLCHQPITAPEAVNTHNPAQVEHATRRDCIRASARRCAEIAEEHEERKYYDSAYLIVTKQIQREFNLEPRQ